jgi:hypothetical protein
LSEATIGYREDKEVANRWAQLFATPYFLVSIVSFFFFLNSLQLKIKTDPQKQERKKIKINPICGK